jgi:hypothetical protein
MATPGTQRYGQHRDLRDTGNTNNSEILATPRTQRYWQHRELRDTGNTENSEILAALGTQDTGRRQTKHTKTTLKR